MWITGVVLPWRTEPHEPIGQQLQLFQYVRQRLSFVQIKVDWFNYKSQRLLKWLLVGGVVGLVGGVMLSAKS